MCLFDSLAPRWRVLQEVQQCRTRIQELLEQKVTLEARVDTLPAEQVGGILASLDQWLVRMPLCVSALETRTCCTILISLS